MSHCLLEEETLSPFYAKASHARSTGRAGHTRKANKWVSWNHVLPSESGQRLLPGDAAHGPTSISKPLVCWRWCMERLVLVVCERECPHVDDRCTVHRSLEAERKCSADHQTYEYPTVQR